MGHIPSTLLRKLLKLSIPSDILLWIFSFLTDRMQAVSSFGQTSTWLPVTQSIIQGSGIRPCLYLIYASDDTTLLVAQHSLADMAQEYNNVCFWSTQNKLSINIHKTKEILFHRPAARNLSIPPLPGIERVKQATLLGIDVMDTLSTAVYVDRLLMQVDEHLYLLSLLQSSGLQRSSLHLLFSALVFSKLTYISTRICWSTHYRQQKQDKCYIKKGHAPWSYTNRVWQRHCYRQVRSQTISAGHWPRSQSAPSSPPKNLHLQILPAL